MRRINLLSVTFAVCVLLNSLPAMAQIAVFPPQVTFSTGYSNLQMQRTNNLFYDHSGPYFDTDFTWQLRDVRPLQVGIAITGSGYWDRQTFALPADNSFYYPYEGLYSNVGLFEIEPRIGLHLGRETGFFAVPRLGAGLLVNSYDIDQATTNNGNTYFSTDHHTGAAFEIRPAVQAGYSWRNAAAGVEASYLYSWGDFGAFGHHAQEFRIGAFFTLSF